MNTPTDNGNLVAALERTTISRIHILGIGGSGMASFACLLQGAGYAVTGSDAGVYPPMSEVLAKHGIDALTPYSEANLDLAKPDLVVVGNVIRRENPEARAVRERGLRQMSFPAAFSALFLKDRHSMVVAGTHGKTTTTTMLAAALVALDFDPTFLAGGVSRSFGESFRLGRGNLAVVEGDEYDTAYFDKGPKFLHYRPKTLVLTSLELDHADIYRDLAHYESSFAALVAMVPPDGTIAVCAEWPNAVALARRGGARVVTYGVRSVQGVDLTAQRIAFGGSGTTFEVVGGDKALGTVTMSAGGTHNVNNALGVWAALESLGCRATDIARGLAAFAGVKRRQEVLGEFGGVRIIDDFAHHPTAVSETIHAVQGMNPGRRLWAVFEPRSNTSRTKLHQDAYPRAFEGASRVSILRPAKHDRIPHERELDIEVLVAALCRRGIEARCHSSAEALTDEILAEARSGDVILAMSNGSFSALVERLVTGFAKPRPALP